MPIDPTPAPNDSAAAVDPAFAYRAALGRYEPAALRAILQGLGLEPPGTTVRAGELAGAIAGRLDGPRAVEAILAEVPPASRLALGLFALTEQAVWPLEGLGRALRLLGVEPVPATAGLLGRGLLALRFDASRPTTADLEVPYRLEATGGELVAHPQVMATARTVRPQDDPGSAPRIERVRQVREADGLEPILRAATLWQRVAETPLRQTQHGLLYKRDRDRLESDPALVGPIADILAPMPDPLEFWLALARGVGLLIDESGTDRIVAAPAGYWTENAVHLPQMLALRWLGLREWLEHEGAGGAVAPGRRAGPIVRPVVLLRLAALDPGQWLALDDLAGELERREPGWMAPLPYGVDALPAPPVGPAGDDSVSPIAAPEPIAAPARRASRRGRAAAVQPVATGGDWLRAMLLGPAYQLGLVRAAEEDPSGRRVVQLTDLGRYILALGPPPAPRPGFDHFLFVQPNFEIIAYRQGLNPALIGQFSRFARWSQLGAAVELTLTPEDLYRGLEGGLTPEAVLERLGRHSERPLPGGVAETLRSWAVRRERISYHAAATLLEFATPEDLEAALVAWPDGTTANRVAGRLLLIEGEGEVPFHRLRMLGARDYRRPPEACVEVEPDGITLTLDPNRSDLLVDAELGRLADELPLESTRGGSSPLRRRFRITPRTLERASAEGLTPTLLSRWFHKRTGSDMPPAVRLLLHPRSSDPAPVAVRRPVVLTVETAELLDGLFQHPDTRAYLGDRLGPTAAVVADAALDRLRHALAGLGLGLTTLDQPDRG